MSAGPSPALLTLQSINSSDFCTKFTRNTSAIGFSSFSSQRVYVCPKCWSRSINFTESGSWRIAYKSLYSAASYRPPGCSKTEIQARLLLADVNRKAAFPRVRYPFVGTRRAQTLPPKPKLRWAKLKSVAGAVWQQVMAKLRDSVGPLWTFKLAINYAVLHCILFASTKPSVIMLAVWAAINMVKLLIFV